MSDAEKAPKYRLVTNAKQVAPAPPLRQELVVLDEWKHLDDEEAPPAFLAWELTAGQYAAFMEEGRVYEDGQLKRYDVKDEDWRFLSHTLRDPNGNRLWYSGEAVKAQLQGYGRAAIVKLLAAANKANSGKPARAEGNSEKTQSDS